MFTGLIREIGTLRSLRPGREIIALDVHAPLTAPDLDLGDSVAVNGICLTVTRCRGSVVTFDAVHETCRVTTLKRWQSGRKLHLEPALRAGQALDGHLVLGHVDGVGTIDGIQRRGGSLLMTVKCGSELAAWLMPKGSVAVDGVSLTVDAGPHTDRFTVNLIPHTLSWTVFDSVRRGQPVNLEMDVLVKAARTGRTAQVFGGLGGEQPTTTSNRASVTNMDAILDRGFGRKGKS